MDIGKLLEAKVRLSLEDVVKFKLDELKVRIDAYQKYVTITLQVTVFYYATTGAVVGFYLNKNNILFAYFLWLPILIGALLGGIFIYGASLQKEASDIIKKIRNDLNRAELGIEEIPDIHFLRLLLLISGIMYFIIGAALIVLPRIGVATSLRGLTNYPPELIPFAYGGVGILVVGMLSTYFFLKKFDRKYRGAQESVSNTEVNSDEETGDREAK